MANCYGMTHPSLKELQADFVGNVKTNLRNQGIDAANLRYSVIDVISNMLAGSLYSMYQFADYQAKNTNLLYCDEETLASYSQIFGVDRLTNQPATAYVTIRGVNSETVTLLPGTVVTDNRGNEYVSEFTQFVLQSEITTVQFKSVASGAFLNSKDENFTFQYGQGGLDDVNPGYIVDGLDNESMEQWRSRILDDIAKPVFNGREDQWQAVLQHGVAQIPFTVLKTGVTRAFAKNSPALGVMNIFFAVDDTAHIQGVPTLAEIAYVQQYADSIAPIGMKVYVNGIIPAYFDVVISGFKPLDDGSSYDQQYAAIQSNLIDLLIDFNPNQNLRLSDLHRAISESDHVDYYNLDSPSSDISNGTTGVPGYPNSIIWQTAYLRNLIVAV